MVILSDEAAVIKSGFYQSRASLHGLISVTISDVFNRKMCEWSSFIGNSAASEHHYLCVFSPILKSQFHLILIELTRLEAF